MSTKQKKEKNKEDKYNEVGRDRNIFSDIYNSWRLFKRHWLPAVTVFGTVVTIATLYASIQKPSYRAQGQLLFKQEDKTLMGLQSGDQQTGPQASGWMDADRILDTETRVLLSAPVLQQTLDAIQQDSKVRGLPDNIEEFQQDVAIKKSPNTNVLVVSYQSKDPNIAALVVNQLMKTYLDKNLLATRATATAARKFITAQLPKVTENVVSADLALRRFKEKYNVTDLDATKGALSRNTERIEAQIDSVQAQLSDLKSRNKALEEKLGMSSQQAIAIGSLRQSPMVQGVLEDYRDVERKLADARARFDEGHPSIVQLKDKEKQIKTLLEGQVTKVLKNQQILFSNKLQVGQLQDALTDDLIKSEVSRIGLVNQLQTLNNQKNFYQQQAAILPRLEQQQRELERQRLVAESTYEALLKSLQEVRIRENQTVGNVRIIEIALTPSKPINSKKTAIIAAGSLAGILLAAAVIYFLEVTDKKIQTVREARELFDYTLLGTIPLFDKKGQLPVIEQPRSSASESYWLLQANLKYLNEADSLKVMVVTSSVPKEGKSTTCANLAASMAQLGYKVLIVDADMHCPLQHQLWKIPNTKGLSNILSEDFNLQGNVFHTVLENLDVITSGTLPTNPLRVIDSRSMATLIEQCSKNYDYVFIDTPALALAADAASLGRMADGVVIVTRPGIADSNSSRLAKESLDQSGQNILGIVVNGVLPENEPRNSLLNYYSHANGNGFKGAASRERNWLDNLKFIKRS